MIRMDTFFKTKRLIHFSFWDIFVIKSYKNEIPIQYSNALKKKILEIYTHYNSHRLAMTAITQETRQQCG